MSDQQLQQLPDDAQIVEKKRAAWGKIGVSIHNTEKALQLRAQKISNSLVLPPTDTKEIQKAEEALKLATQNRVALEEDRKKITGTLNDVINRLMVPEKSVTAAISTFTGELIKLKKRADEEEKTNQQKAQELKQVVEKVRLYIAEINASFLQETAKLISDSYKHALENIKPEDIEVYKEKFISLRITEKKYTIQSPTIKAVYNTQAVIDQEIAKVFKPKTAAEYVEGFKIDIKNKYSDYKLAWENKEQALLLNKKEEAETAEAINQQKQQDVVAANVQAMISTPVVGWSGKSLKEVYKLAMDETFESANIICMAYIANSNKCREKLQVTKWLSGFGTKQMIGALEKIKNEDEKFDFNGLVWTKTDKL